MQRFRALLVMFPLLAALVSCKKPMSPITEGTVNYKTDNSSWASKSLTDKQIKELSSWLEKSASDWGRCFITPPGAILSVSLKHADGTSSSLEQLNFSNSKTTLLARHLSGSNLSEQPCALQNFNEAEIALFRRILGVPE